MRQPIFAAYERTILSEEHLFSLSGTFKFETIGFLGRLLLSGKPKNRFPRKLLNFGCGYTWFDGWTNGDFFHLPVRFWRKNQRRTPDWMFDARYPLRCPDNYWDGVFTEHTLEHFTPVQVMRILRELYRTIKPGGRLRIIVPDIRKAVEYYQDKKSHPYFHENFPTGCEAIWYVTQCHLHLSVWDGELMSEFCTLAGFVNAKELAFGVGEDPEIIRDSAARQPISLYVEAQKPG
ncbi:MAG: methyltransferase domain-containing protein [Lewinellaceae bacterium]|nr:methyltransferase domain-containing protein [Lewinellaceae bacterium]